MEQKQFCSKIKCSKHVVNIINKYKCTNDVLFRTACYLRSISKREKQEYLKVKRMRKTT